MSLLAVGGTLSVAGGTLEGLDSALDYATEVAADEPLLWLRLDEASGTTAADSGSLGANGTLTGTGVTYEVDSPFQDGSKAMKLAASSGTLTIADVADLRLNQTAWSIEWWMKLEDGIPGSGFPSVANKGNGFTAGSGGWVVFIEGNSGKLSFKRDNDSDLLVSAGATGAAWRHYLMTFDDGVRTFYVNGVPQAAIDDGTYQTNTGTADLVWGGTSDLLLKDVAVYDSALSAERAAAHYRAAVGFADGPKLAWAPPELTDPITFNPGNVNNSSYHEITAIGQDVIIFLPALPLGGSLYSAGQIKVNAARNVVIVGGEIYQADTADGTANAIRRALSLSNITGTIHIEGLKVHGDFADACNIHSSPDAIAQFVNCEFHVKAQDEVDFTDSHPDAIFVDNVANDGFNLAELRVDRCTVVTDYQGISVFGKGTDADIRNTDITSLSASQGVINQVLWMSDDATDGGDMTLTEVYVTPRDDLTVADQTYLDDEGGSGTLTGAPKLGPPADGSFAPANVGLEYVTPGYA